MELRVALLGVGEALRREIAGLVLVGRLLWGFVGWTWRGDDLTIRSNWSSEAKFGFAHASIQAICEVFHLYPGLCRVDDLISA